MTTNHELERKLRHVPGFAGVFASNQLPARLGASHTRPFSLIANYDRAGMPGSHWIGMRFPAHAPAEYFDSFGLAPDMADRVVRVGTHFGRYLSRHSATGTFRHNAFDFQCLEDDTCGEWAALFVEHGLPDDNPGFWRPIMDTRSCLARDQEARNMAAILPPSERHISDAGPHLPLTSNELKKLMTGKPA